MKKIFFVLIPLVFVSISCKKYNHEYINLDYNPYDREYDGDIWALELKQEVVKEFVYNVNVTYKLQEDIVKKIDENTNISYYIFNNPFSEKIANIDLVDNTFIVKIPIGYLSQIQAGGKVDVNMTLRYREESGSAFNVVVEY
jgi:hypothetical protein